MISKYYLKSYIFSHSNSWNNKYLKLKLQAALNGTPSNLFHLNIYAESADQICMTKCLKRTTWLLSIKILDFSLGMVTGFGIFLKV